MSQSLLTIQVFIYFTHFDALGADTCDGSVAIPFDNSGLHIPTYTNNFLGDKKEKSQSLLTIQVFIYYTLRNSFAMNFIGPVFTELTYIKKIQQ